MSELSANFLLTHKELPTIEKKLTTHSLISQQQQQTWLQILGAPTQMSSSGFPFLEDQTFSLIKQEIPQLFQNGLKILLFLHTIEDLPQTVTLTATEQNHFANSLKVLRNIIFTANVTAPSDLWLLRMILSTFKKAELTDYLLHHKEIDIEDVSAKFLYNKKQMQLDLDLLTVRGYLLKNTSKNNTSYRLNDSPQINDVFSLPPLQDEELMFDWVEVFRIAIRKQEFSHLLWDRFGSFCTLGVKDFSTHQGWVASASEIEKGYKLLPLVLALRVEGKSYLLNKDTNIAQLLKLEEDSPLCSFLNNLGYSNEEGKVTEIGARVFERGPGPMGIIHAYLPYMKTHFQTLLGIEQSKWVSRGVNVAASQDANRKTFAAAHKALNAFCQRYQYNYNVFIEHAVGRGEATRQHFENHKEKEYRYFGADLEDAAIDAALVEQSKGLLPEGMEFVRKADIGEPESLLVEFTKRSLSSHGAVMMVGNGFHEIRQQTNDKMIATLKKYADAGLILIFTEESGLGDEDILNTAWNTYHAGFRYVHELSGQGLRPAISSENDSRLSWENCAVKAGYVVLDEYTVRTRTIYPTPQKDGRNPSISVTYFCVPKTIWQGLTAE